MGNKTKLVIKLANSRKYSLFIYNKIGHSSRSSSIQRSETTEEVSGNVKQFFKKLAFHRLKKGGQKKKRQIKRKKTREDKKKKRKKKKKKKKEKKKKKKKKKKK